jgi:hypothetical protein
VTSPPSDVPLPAPPPEKSWADQNPRRLIAIGVAAMIAVMLVGWLAIRGLRSRSLPAAQTEMVVEPVAAPPAPVADLPPMEPAAPVQASPLAALPTDPAARAALYDSLWSARSPLFDPLLAAVESATEDRPVERAIASWREGGVDVQEGDLLHSALVQEALSVRIGRQLDIDGQLLRNPCRGGSCTALLGLWRLERARYGFPEVPADAATNTTALRQVEAALVLDWMKDGGAHAGGAAP